jgi:hypothetical protein
LEDRVVLSHAANRGLSVIVSGLTPGQQVLNRHQQPVIAEVNQAFDSFTNDFDQARATYFASILNVPNPSAATGAFMEYTTQRVSLLSEQLISSILQSSQGTARPHGQMPSLQHLITTKIIGGDLSPPRGQLISSLNSITMTIPTGGPSAPTATLYSLSQDNAIESARTAVINGVNILRNGDFGNKAKH